MTDLTGAMKAIVSALSNRKLLRFLAMLDALIIYALLLRNYTAFTIFATASVLVVCFDYHDEKNGGGKESD